MTKKFYLAHSRDPNRYYHSSQSGLGSNGNEEVLHICQSSRIEASSSDGLVSNLEHLWGGVLTLYREMCVENFSCKQWNYNTESYI